MGGGDKTAETCAVLESLSAFSFPDDFRLTVVVGSSGNALDAVSRAASRLSCKTEVLSSPQDFPEVLKTSAIAIGAGGVTALERCCLGIPGVSIVLADNQRRGAAELARLGATFVIFDVSKVGQLLPGMLTSLQDPVVASEMSSRAMAVTDGLGVCRVADILRGSVGQRISQGGLIRRMNEADLATVRAWRNHADIRACMMDQDLVTEEQHRAWFEKASRSPGRVLLIFEEDGQARGFVQFTETRRDSRVADWGFYAAPGAPKGIGRRLCAHALRFAFDVMGYHKVCGQVLDYNLRSQRLHLAVGFEAEGVLRQQHRNDARYCDVLCYGYLNSTWKDQAGIDQ
jgi:UDP-4-amino-4,6-dideoxy-N-acetyl-beta-L-altrosamine N-acetyltransferase